MKNTWVGIISFFAMFLGFAAAIEQAKSEKGTRISLFLVKLAIGVSGAYFFIKSAFPT